MKFKKRIIRPHAAWFALAVIPVGAVLIAVSSFGPGISSDGIFYYAAANNFAAGKGLVDFRGSLLVHWPPLLSILLGGLKLMTGLDALVLALGVNLLSYAAIFWGVLLLARESNLQRLFWPTILFLIVAFSSSLIGLASNVASDVLFIALTLPFLVWLMRYFRSQDRKTLAAAALFVAAASLLRYVGAALIVTGLVAIGIANWKQWRKALADTLVFGAISSFPVAAWAVGMNYGATGTLVGSRNLAAIQPMENLLYSFSRMLHWFLPTAITKLPYFVWIAIGIAVFVAAVIKRDEWRSFFRRLGDSKIILVLFTVIYLAFVVFTTFTRDHFASYDDRYQLPLLFPVLIIVFFFIESLVLPKLGRFGTAGLAGGFLLFLAFHGFLTYRLVSQSLNEGVTYYNVYNTRALNQSPFVTYLQSFDYEPGLRLYTNDPEALYFFTKRETRASLIMPEEIHDDRFYLRTEIGSWPGEPRAYLIWFTKYFNTLYVTPHRLSIVADVQQIYAAQGGTLYQIAPKAP